MAILNLNVKTLIEKHFNICLSQLVDEIFYKRNNFGIRRFSIELIYLFRKNEPEQSKLNTDSSLEILVLERVL